MSYANFVCDLHGHTNRSDGNDTPVEFLLHAAERGMSIVALTDHDKKPPETVTVDGHETGISEYASGLGLILIPGIEISCETYIDEVHLVCLGCDWNDSYFDELDEFTAKSKIDAYKKLVEKLGEKGMPLTWDEVLTSGGTRIDEGDVQKKMIFNLMAQKGYAKDWSAAKLLVKADRDLSIPREKPDAVDVIHTAHRLGGIVIMAHPYLVSEEVSYKGERISRADFIDHLIYEGLDGIEARYTYDKTSYKGKQTKKEIYHEVVGRYAGRVPVISGGSDYHADGKKGVKNPRDIGECGLTMSEFLSNDVLLSLLSE